MRITIFTNVTGKVRLKTVPPDSYTSDWIVNEANNVVQPPKGFGSWRPTKRRPKRETLAYLPITPGSVQLVDDGLILRDDRLGGFMPMHTSINGFVLGSPLAGYAVNYETGELAIPHSREVVATYCITYEGA